MEPIIEHMIAGACAIAVVLGLWRIANILKRHGVVARPASTMDHVMTRLEADHAQRQAAVETSTSAIAGAVKTDA